MNLYRQAVKLPDNNNALSLNSNKTISPLSPSSSPPPFIASNSTNLGTNTLPSSLPSLNQQHSTIQIPSKKATTVLGLRLGNNRYSGGTSAKPLSVEIKSDEDEDNINATLLKPSNHSSLTPISPDAQQQPPLLLNSPDSSMNLSPRSRVTKNFFSDTNNNPSLLSNSNIMIEISSIYLQVQALTGLQNLIFGLSPLTCEVPPGKKIKFLFLF